MAEKKLEDLYPSNSTISKTPKIVQKQEKTVPIVNLTGGVTQKKKSIGRRIADTFLGPDVVDVRAFLINDVFIPATKNIVVDILDGFRDSIELALFGTSRGRINHQRYGQSNTVLSYSQYWNGRNSQKPQQTTVNYVGKNVPKDLIFTNNAEAMEVLNNLCDMIDTYGAVSVSELNEMLGLPKTFTDQDWGWTNLATASVRAVRGGYLLDLPKTMPIK